jgi:hypothetical protein
VIYRAQFSWVAVPAIIMIHLAAASIPVKSTDTFLLARGSDVTAEILMPAIWAQVAAIGMLSLICLLAFKVGAKGRLLLAYLWITIMGSASHRVVFDRASSGARR